MTASLGLALLVLCQSAPADRGLDAPRLAGSNPISCLLLTSPRVQDELKLSPAQVQACVKLKEQYAAKLRAFNLLKRERDGRVPSHDEDFNAYLQYELTRDVESVLTAQQFARFLQINFQGQSVSSYFDGPTRRRLGLTSEQSTEFDAIRKRLQAQLDPVRMAKEIPDAEARIAHLRKIRSDLRAEVVAILTEGQRGRLKELEGPEFAFRPVGGTRAVADPGGRSDRK